MHEAYLAGGEQAADPAGHSVIGGTAPAGRALRLRKQFTAATSQAGWWCWTRSNDAHGAGVGRYTWHVNPSKRPLFASSSEAWTMTCEEVGPVLGTALVSVARGARATQDFRCDGTGAGDGGRRVRDRHRPGHRQGARARAPGAQAVDGATAFARGRRTKGAIDRFCLTGGGAVRVGYPAARLRRKLSRRERGRVKGRAVLLLELRQRDAAARRWPRAITTRALTRRIGKVRPVEVGSTRWYVGRGSGARHVFRVTGGKVREVGLADVRLTASRARAKRLASFR